MDEISELKVTEQYVLDMLLLTQYMLSYRNSNHM